jgi:hypothetical protein
LQVRDVLSPIWIPKFFIPDPAQILGGKKAPDPTVRYIKRGMKNETNLLLAPYGFKTKFYQ